MRLVGIPLITCVLASAALADSTQALVDEAAKLYEQADLAGALAKLEKAYERSKRADILFGIARIHVDRGNCAKAIEAYRSFLESRPKPGPRSTQIATEKIAECQRILATSEPSEPEPEPEPDPEPRVEPVETPMTRVVRRPWYTDVVGDALVLGGVAGVAVGAYFFVGARSDVDEANRGGAGGVTAEEYLTLRDRAKDRHTYATIAASVGGVLVLGGILKYALGDRTEVVPVHTVGGGTSGGLAIRGRF